MALRDFVLNDFRWKATAFILAVSVWFIIQSHMQSGDKAADSVLIGAQTELVPNVPITVLINPRDKRSFELEPKTVNVTVQIRGEALKNPNHKGIRVFVDLTDISNTEELADVLTYAPGGITVKQVEPTQVTVKRITENRE